MSEGLTELSMADDDDPSATLLWPLLLPHGAGASARTSVGVMACTHAHTDTQQPRAVSDEMRDLSAAAVLWAAAGLLMCV